jgi:hypothetical protein
MTVIFCVTFVRHLCHLSSPDSRHLCHLLPIGEVTR